jgi:hypothetical protein
VLTASVASETAKPSDSRTRRASLSLVASCSTIRTIGLESIEYTDGFDTPRSSKRSAKWLEDNYGYGHANTLARPSSSDLLRALQLTNPKAVTLPNAYLDRDAPRRAVYAKLWEEVKAS